MATAPYRIEFAPAALREFRDLPRKVQEQLRPKIDLLAENPRPQKVEKLKGAEGLYRIRAGDYRVIYSIEDDRLVVLILRIAHRRDVYKHLP